MANRVGNSKEMQELADRMLRAANGYDTQEIFFACALIMSWTLVNQSDETRANAVNIALHMIKDGKAMLEEAAPDTLQ
jgi:thymidine phosphorylase